jgi:hypothetical protein
MFRVFINLMIENEKMKKYFINFKTKDYFNRYHVDVEKATKKRDFKTRTWHYIIICQTYQLHDEKNERKNLRRVIFETSTIKINEVLDDICVIQSKSRVKNSRKIKNIKFIKIAKKLIRFITSIVKIAKEFILFNTSIEESIREKRRNSKNDQSRHQKRSKRDQSKNEKEIINLEFEESDVKFRKTRVQIRKEILKKLKKIIDASKKSQNNSKIMTKNSIMSNALQDSVTSFSKQRKLISSEKKTREFTLKTSQFHKELRTYIFINEQKEQFKTEMKFLITTLEIYQKVFWDLDDEIAKLINERQLKSFFQKWNKVVKQITKIHQKLDDAKRLTRNISIEKWRINHHKSQFFQILQFLFKIKQIFTFFVVLDVFRFSSESSFFDCRSSSFQKKKRKKKKKISKISRSHNNLKIDFFFSTFDSFFVFFQKRSDCHENFRFFFVSLETSFFLNLSERKKKNETFRSIN